MKDNLYTYKAYVTDVYDGDTITINIDLGLHSWIKKEKIRLYGINAPEIRGFSRKKGIESRDYLRSLILNKGIYLKTHKDKKGKYGRYLGSIYLESGEYVNRMMVKYGYAKVYSV